MKITKGKYKFYLTVCNTVRNEISNKRIFHHASYRKQALRSINALMHRINKMSEEDLVADILSEGKELTEIDRKLNKIRKYVSKHSWKNTNLGRIKISQEKISKNEYDEHSHIRAKNCKKIQ